MLVAQAMGEYGAVTLASAIQSGGTHAEMWIRSLGAKEYAVIVIAGVVLFKILSPRR